MISKVVVGMSTPPCRITSPQWVTQLFLHASYGPVGVSIKDLWYSWARIASGSSSVTDGPSVGRAVNSRIVVGLPSPGMITWSVVMVPRWDVTVIVAC